MISEDTLRIWSKRPSDSERERIDRTERMIRDAIAKSDDPRVQKAKVFAKGSVKSNTNIRKASDIDICVQAEGIFFTDYPDDKTDKDFGVVTSIYEFTEFRNNVEKALINHFGTQGIDTTGSKAIHINNTSSRIDADVVPAFEYRSYNNNGVYSIGIELRSIKNNNERIINWPHHNYNNNLAKHNNTSQRYRKMVRIFKRTREAMIESGTNYNHDSQSFLIESLLWNVPDSHFGNDKYFDDLINILNFLRQQLSTPELIAEWGEVNEQKYLFRKQQKWTAEGALAFINNVDHYLGNVDE